MHLDVTTLFKQEMNSAKVLLRPVLFKDEVYRLPKACRGVQVLAGRAWLAISGEDIILAQGQKMLFDRDRDGVLVSALGDTPLILEASGDSSTTGKLSPAQALTELVTLRS